MKGPGIIIFDSGLGGLTVQSRVRELLPGANYLYVADNAAFPYGDLDESELVTRLLALFAILIEREKPDICVIACNTASTIGLAPLREHFSIPFVGTVPAIKVAAEKSRSRVFSVLATPGTVRREYTHDLVSRFASGCKVELVGAARLAAMAEEHMRGRSLDRQALAEEIAPAFVEHDGRRTDMIALGCTHYPLLTEQMKRLAPWPVEWIDPAPAIARQSRAVLESIAPLRPKGWLEAAGRKPSPPAGRFLHTGTAAIAHKLEPFLRDLGMEHIVHDPIIG